MIKETTLIRIYIEDKERLESQGRFRESIADVLNRELAFAEFGRKQDKNKNMCKEIEDKLSRDKNPKKNKIKTPKKILETGKYM